MRPLLPALLALLAVAAGPGAAAPPDTRAQVDAIFKDLDRSDSPGCALAVYRDGLIVYTRGYGMANLELGAANSPATVFDIASTSKQFTALAIRLLARDGKLSLDDDIRKWVPEVPAYGKTITIRNLIHHTGGLRDYLELLSLQGVRDEDLMTAEDAVEILSLQKAPNFPPGERYLYSNSGYFLLSLIVKRSSGKSLRDFAAEEIFGPLGMRHTQFNDSHARIIPNRATGYTGTEGGGFGIAMSDFEQTGDGSVLTTVEDLFRWDQNFYDAKVGDRSLLDAMLTPGVLNSGKKLDYASALRIGSYRGLPTVSHGGSWVGYRSQLLRFPRQKFSVACLCNLAEANPSRLARRVAEVYLGSLMDKVPAEGEKGAKTARGGAAPEELERLAGLYRSPSTGEVFRVAVENGRLVARTDSARHVLAPIAPKRFSIEGFTPPDLGEVEFEMISGASRPRLRVMTREDDEEEREAYEPAPAWRPTPAAIAQLAGTYASEELGTSWKLVAENGALVIRHRGFSGRPLAPTVEDTMSLEGMSLHFTRGASKSITGFTLDAGRAQGIVFVRVGAG